jgi:ligand-binding sensor domain-containing protein/serine phosphatase RsbU (regulator of sigma subunit)
MGAVVAAAAEAADGARSFDQYATRAWTQSEGLPQNTVSSIAQTPEGYLWLATEGGLVRFDGVTMTTFDRRNQPHLLSANVLTLGVDGAGVLWVGTTAGVHRLVKGKLEPLPLAAGSAHNPGVTALAFQPETTFVGTDAGLFRVRDGVATKLLLPGASDQQVSAVTAVGSRVLVGTPSGLFAVDGDAVRDITQQVRLPFRDVRALGATRDGSVLVGGRGEFVKLGDHPQHVARAEGMPSEPVTAFLEGERGLLWVCTDGAGLLRVGVKGIERFTARDGLVDDHVKAIFDDHRGGLWLGTSGGGLQRAFAGPAVTFGALHGLAGQDVRSVFGSRSGDLWVGTEGAGVFRREGGSFVEAGIPAARTVYGFVENDKGVLFASTRESGVVELAHDGTPAHALAGTESLRVRSIVLGDDGTPEWIATHGQGVMRRVGDRFETVAPEVVAPGLIVFFVQRDADGVFAGTRAGLFRVAASGATRVELPIPNDASVLHRRVDAAGDEWLGTSAGIVWRHGGTWTVIDAPAGLPDEQVYATVEQPAGTIWASSNRGVIRIEKRSIEALAAGSTKAVVTRAFGPADGFRTLESNAGDPSVFVDPMGAVWFGTTMGLTRVDPAKVTLSAEAPVPHLEQVLLDRDVVTGGNAMQFTSGRHDLALAFTAFDYAAPSAITFAHRLDGLDSAWIDDGARRDANYTDLRPGQYRFRLKACSVDGACAELASPLSIVVTPRWFERRGFWVVVVAGLGLAGWLAARARIRSLHRRARDLEDRVEERTMDLRKALAEVESKDRLLLADIEEAARFQAIALRLNLENAEIGTGLRAMPAALVGGDLVDAFELAAGHYRFFIADTTGHGVQAALRTMVLKTEYEALKWQQEWPHALLGMLNEVLVANFPDLELRSTAACFDIVRASAGGWELRFANAAAPEIFLERQGELVEIYQPGPFLGMMAGSTFTMKRQMLPPGARLVVFTDGLFEQDGAQGAFGHERIEAIVKAHRGTAQELADELGDAVRAYAMKPELDDDVTVLVLDVDRLA